MPIEAKDDGDPERLLVSLIYGDHGKTGKLSEKLRKTVINNQEIAIKFGFCSRQLGFFLFLFNWSIFHKY